jgi:hypothetical protein
MLTKESINKFYLDFSGQEVIILSEQVPCCTLKHYLGNIIGTANIFCYDSAGRRLDHRWKVDVNSIYNLEKEV